VRGRIGVPVDRDHSSAESLKGERQLAAELSRAQQHHRGPVQLVGRRLVVPSLARFAVRHAAQG
jgi:hypothetical protein